MIQQFNGMEKVQFKIIMQMLKNNLIKLKKLKNNMMQKHILIHNWQKNIVKKEIKNSKMVIYYFYYLGKFPEALK